MSVVEIDCGGYGETMRWLSQSFSISCKSMQAVVVESGRVVAICARQTIITSNDEVLTIQSTRFLFDNQICYSIKTRVFFFISFTSF